jgi:hypothetical protein
MNNLSYESKKKHHLPSPILSDHVVEEIFARLPVKHVFRLRCLSRAWAARLSSAGFEDLYLRAANRGGPKILCMMQEVDDGIPTVLASSLDGPGGAPFLDAPRAITGHCYPPLITRDMHLYPRYKRAPHLTTQPCRGLVVMEALEARLFHVFNLYLSMGSPARRPDPARPENGPARPLILARRTGPGQRNLARLTSQAGPGQKI